MIKRCIWCSKDETKTTFNKLAHTIPQSLGGKKICKNVCDDCNHYFGNCIDSLPPIETVFKETFNISRAKFLYSTNEIGKNKSLAKFSSIYFDVDFNKRRIKLKNKYKFHLSFQEKICRQIKRGIYKVFLEELERQKGIAHSSKYDFIREFARYNLIEYPVIYFQRKHGMIIGSIEWAKNPELFFEKQFTYLIESDSFFEFEFLGHVFSIATTKYWNLEFESYINKSMTEKVKFFTGYKFITNFNDIDLTLNILDN